MKGKWLKFLAGFVVGCLVMLAALIGMYFYMASREPVTAATGFEGGIFAIAFIKIQKAVSSKASSKS